MLVQAFVRVQKSRDGFGSETAGENSEIRQRGSEPEKARVCLQKQSRVREDEAGEQ